MSTGRATLLLLNGPPAVGKSTLARAVAAARPLTLVVEVDDLRTAMSGWEVDESSKERARRLAVALVDDHLGAGHDVIVPQFLGRAAFAEELATVAGRHGARFIEVVLVADPRLVIERFEHRRRLGDLGHPAREVEDPAKSVAIAMAALRGRMLDDGSIRTVDVDDVDALVELLTLERRDEPTR